MSLTKLKDKSPKSKYVPGYKKGLLTVIRFVEHRKKSLFVEVVCECGTNKIVNTSTLSDNHTTVSCGCVGKNRHQREPGKTTWTRNYNRYKSNAKWKGLEFSLSLEEFKEISTEDCNYCGSAPVSSNACVDSAGNSVLLRGRKNTTRFYSKETIERAWIKVNGIDRIDSSLGYVTGNIVPCCSQCNWMKSDYSESEFLTHLNKINDYQQKKNKNAKKT